MMDEYKLHAQLAKGDQAQAELKLTAEAFQGLRRDLVRAWEATDPRDTVGREKLWIATTQLTQVESALRTFVSNGQIAAKDIDRIRTSGQSSSRLSKFIDPFKRQL